MRVFPSLPTCPRTLLAPNNRHDQAAPLVRRQNRRSRETVRVLVAPNDIAAAPQRRAACIEARSVQCRRMPALVSNAGELLPRTGQIRSRSPLMAADHRSSLILKLFPRSWTASGQTLLNGRNSLNSRDSVERTNEPCFREPLAFPNRRQMRYCSHIDACRVPHGPYVTHHHPVLPRESLTDTAHGDRR